MKRPILWAAVSFACGVAIAHAVPLESRVFPAALGLAGLGAAAFGGRDRRFFLAGMLAVFGAAGAFRWDVSAYDPAGDAFSRWIEAADPETVTVYGRVVRADLFAPGDDYFQCVLDVSHRKSNGVREPMQGRTLIRWNAAAQPVYPGDRIAMQGAPTVVLSPVNWDVHSYEDTLRLRGVHSTIRCSGDRALVSYDEGAPYSPFNAAARFRTVLAQRLTNAVPEWARPFIFAVWLGDRSGLSRDEYDSFIRSGTAHILAVSGVHTSIVFVTVSFVLGRFIPIARYRAVFVMAAIAVFALTAGARAATVRAALMIAVYILADVFDRERDAPTALGIAGLLFLLWEPVLLFDGGAQLSFLSIASILVFTERLSAQVPLLPTPVKDAAAATVGVQLLPLPVAATMFHLIPRFAPFANLLVIPLLGIALWLCLITSVTAFISPPLAQLFGHAAGGVVFAIEKIAGAVAGMPFSAQPISKPTTIAAILYWAALATLVIQSRLDRRRRLIASTALAIGALLLWRPLNVPPQLRVLDVGHGDAAIVHTGGGHVALVDGGDQSEYGDMGERVVIPSLAALGHTHVDLVFVSHGDRDHLGGLITVVERLPVGRVVMAVPEPDNPVEQRFLEVCEQRNVPVVRAARGDRFNIGGAVFSVLHPPEDWVAEHERNDMSLVLRLEWEGPPVLFTGDIESAAERTLAGRDVRATVLKVPHHGSDSSSSQAFIHAVNPRIALISAGDSRSRLTNPAAVVQRYRAAGIAVWTTRTAGGLVLTLGSGGIDIAGARLARGYPSATARSP